jgi:phenylacetate-CoA ligase
MAFYNRELETLDRRALIDHQKNRLAILIKEIEANRFYREKLRAAGTSFAQRLHLGSIPFTTKNELVSEQREHPPYGRLLTYALEEYRYFHQTSGTTLAPLKWLDTQNDWLGWLRCWGYVFAGAGVTEKDKVFCAFSFGPYISHWAAIDGARAIGALAISGGGMNSEQRLRAIMEDGCTVLLCTPTYALHLAEVAARCGIPLPSSEVRVTIHAGEPGASVPNVKKQIQESWGATCFDHAGATEAGAWAFDCEAQTGAIHLNEAEFIFEVIDPESGEPMEEGACGELVVTNLGRAGMPVLRYRTGDLVEVTPEPCPCGRTFTRIKGGILGRSDDMIVVRGVNLYPSTIDNLIRGVGHVVEYDVTIRRVSGLDDLSIRIEVDETGSFEQIKTAVADAFRLQMSVRVTVERAEPGSLPRYELKSRRYKRVPAETSSQ